MSVLKTTRREAIAVAGLALLGATRMKKMPVVYLPHGGGPWPFVDLGFGEKSEQDKLASYLRSVAQVPAQKPKALLVISAHWEQPTPTVMSSPKPPMLYDYYGFPPASYEIQWPAPGSTALAARTKELLRAFSPASDEARGFDHGTFVPLKLTYPNADVPTVQLSLKAGLDPMEHIAIGQALQPLRDEGVFIIGSGMTYHDMRGFMRPIAAQVSETFDAWLRETGTAPAAQRNERLVQWATAPAGRKAHPREEHLMPLMVCAGAAGDDRGVVAYQGGFAGAHLSAYHFG